MEFNEEWITKGIQAEAVKAAKEMGGKLAQKGVSTSQIRNFFGEIKKIQALGIDMQKGRSRLHMVGPKLAYTIGRMEGNNNREKADAMSELLQGVEKATELIVAADSSIRFNHFVDFMEAMVAYHKYSVLK